MAPTGRLFTKKWKFLTFLGPHSHPPVAIEVKFCTAKRTQVPVGPAKFDLTRCNESHLENFLYRCTPTVLAINYCSRIFFKTLSYLYEVVRTNVCADFLDFRNS